MFSERKLGRRKQEKCLYVEIGNMQELEELDVKRLLQY